MRRIYRWLLLLVAAVAFIVPTSGITMVAQAEERTVFVHLFEWKWKDVAEECEDFLGPKGFAAVQISPPNEHLVLSSGGTQYPWWQRYQPVSYQLQSRSGTMQELKDMISRCNQVGVKVYADVVINHMVSEDSPRGTGSAGTPFDPATKKYTAVPYGPNDFHDKCDINYGNADSIRWCWLGSLEDLKTENDYVRQKAADYLNHLISIGVAGFRIDAAKHMQPDDIANILSRVNQLGSAIDTNTGKPFHQVGRPYVFQEVIEGEKEPVKASEYTRNGDVTEFKYGRKVAEKFRDSTQKISDLRTFPGSPGAADWGLLPSGDAVAFIDNHDNQRGHGSGFWEKDGRIGGILTSQYDGGLYNLANVFMLAWPYGYPVVMSSYIWTPKVEWDNGKQKWVDRNDWVGPPSDSSGKTNDATCFRGDWVCEHRWGNIANMVKFRNDTVSDWTVDNWWDNGNNQIAFSRGDSGFLVINREEGSTLSRTFQTGMARGTYCDILHGDFDEATKSCSGPTIMVDASGRAYFSVPTKQASAIHVGAKMENVTPPQRTVIFIKGETFTGQDMFIRGGIDHTYANNKLGMKCETSNYSCAISIQHRNMKNPTTEPWKQGDRYLDLYGAESGQNRTSHSIRAEGTPMDWTIDKWPANWGEKRTVAEHGFGEDPLNRYGAHYWMLDVDMDCSKTVNGWFEVKSYISNGPGWESDINQSGTPYSSKNHFGQCGKINVFERNKNTAQFYNFP